MSLPRFFDITIPMQKGVAVWPGDTEFQFDFGWKMSEGAAVNVGTVKMSVHTGTHADAPLHFLAEGAAIGALDLSYFLGPAIVVDVSGLATIPWTALSQIDFSLAPRLLLKTGAWTDYQKFPEEVPVLAPDVPENLQKAGVVLLGVDVPSVDRLESKDLPLHHALAGAGIHILESLDLRAVPAGIYHLTALPLRLMEADGSPVRAILQTIA